MHCICLRLCWCPPYSPSPASGLGFAFLPCSVFLAVLRCPGIPPFPFLRFSCGLSVFYLLPLRFFRLRVSLVFSCGFVYVLLLLLCSHFRFVSSPVCYPSFVGWFLSCFASSSSSACGVSGFLPARSATWFLPLAFLVLFRPLLPLSLCVLCLRLFSVRLSCTFLS